MSAKKIGFIVGSLRKESLSRKVANAMATLFPSNYEVEFIDISDLPLFNEDLDVESNVPASWARLRRDIVAKDGFMFFTPEYNRSVSAVLKNSLDIASRPYGANQWDGKVAAVVSVSPGSLAGFGANHHLRQSLTFLNVLTLQQPEAYLGNTADFMAEDGTITNEGTLGFMQSIVDAFVTLTDKNT